MQKLVALLLLACLSGCYTIEQGFRFNNTYNSRVSLREVLRDPDLPPERRRKLIVALEAIGFARAQGLNVGDAYQYAIPDSDKPVSYSVQAAPPDKLEFITWWFPFAGQVPYLGYFKKEERDQKSAELRAQGYDVSEGTVGAFSSLGWFSDPIYYSMLQRPDPDVAQLLLHELVHRTFWSKGSAAFNENLAEAVSLHMTEVYLKAKGQEKDWAQLQGELKKQAIFRQWLVRMKDELTALYARADLGKEQKVEMKNKLIKDFQDNRFPAELGKEYEGARRRPWNNASILGSTLYLPDMKRFDEAYACLGSPTAGGFLAALKKAEKRSKDAEEALAKVCALRPAPIKEL